MRRAALYDIGNIAVGLTGKLNGLKHLIKQLSRSADKRTPLPVFICARPFADDHHFNGIGEAG